MAQSTLGGRTVLVEGEFVVARNTKLNIVLTLLVCLVPVAARDAERPLSKDDVTLLLIGGASQEKMTEIIEKRGVDFQMNPDLAKKFHDEGASDAVIEALVRAGNKVISSAASTPPGATDTVKSTPSSPPSTVPSASASPAASPPKTESKPAASSTASTGGVTPPPSPKGKPGIDLGDPSPDQIQHIIQEFAAKEKLFREARDNYTYHQINRVEELDPDGNVAGTYEQDWDIVYDDTGKRVEQVTYAPLATLKGLIVTAEDLNSMRNIQPFVLSSEELPEYEIKYLGHVRVDEITAYVFSIRPKELVKGHQYFQGTVWVDDRDLQIVKTQGKPVPEVKTKKGQFNLFPRFTTYREQIDGKFWFPTFTMADDTLYFPGQPIHMREVIKYTDYKQFKSTSTIRMVKEIPPEPKGPQKNESAKKSPPK
jgi:hypothetical protein